MKELTLVTAFWDVGRGDSTKGYAHPRTNDRYYNEFKVWARMKNKLIVFTDSQTAEVVRKIRSDFKLSDRTIIHVIDNVFDIEPSLFFRMKAVEQNIGFRNFRYYKNAMSNVAKFDYAWLMKYWCLMKAAEDADKNTMFAWMDFGFNHIDTCYTNPNEFSFLWKCNLSEDKIHVFSLMSPDSFASVESLQYLFDCMLGVISIVPQKLCEKFWNLMKKAMEALLMLDCIDDDQQLLLMATRECPEIFEIHQSDWFMPIKENGGEHLTIREKKNIQDKPDLTHKLKNIISNRKENIYHRHLLHFGKSQYGEYAYRVYTAARKHYDK